MSQADLSKSLDTSPGNVNRWAKGDGVPSYELCKKLLELGMTIEELFGISISRVELPNDNAEFREGMNDPDFNTRVEQVILEMKAKGKL